MRTTLSLITVVLLLQGCAARATTPVQGPASDPLATLQRDLGALFNASSVEHAQWGVKVVSLGAKATLYGLNASRFMIPASNQKLLTMAAAAERLGWDYRFSTRLMATGPLGPDGTIDGDLVIIGDGDPTINPRHPARWSALDDWAAALKAKGIKAVGGHVVGDDNAFAEPGWGVGWAWDNLQDGYGARVGALQYNENQVQVIVGTGMSPGDKAIIATSPIGSGLFIVNGVTTSAAGTASGVELARVPGSPFLQVRGQIAADGPPLTVLAAVPNPTDFYLEAFREALKRHGITVAGIVVDIDDMGEPPKVEGNIELVVDRSPPLSEIVEVTMKWSRNGYAESVVLAMAPPGAPATGARGLGVVRETLAAWGISPEGYLPRDGSGLSRYDYVSADVLTQLLEVIAANPKHADPFRSTLPVAGISGTLANRMKGTPAEGRVVAKTGSLSNVRTLAGYTTTLAGEPIVFAILCNNFRVPAAEIDAVMDEALVRLVEFRR